MGLDSILGVEWIQSINRQYGTAITASTIYDYPTIREFADFMKRELGGRGNSTGSSQPAAAAGRSTGATPLELQPLQPEKFLREELRTSLARILCVEKDGIGLDKKFIDMGLDSILGVEWVQSINRQCGTAIAASTIYDYPTIRELSGFLEKESGNRTDLAHAASTSSLALDEVLLNVQHGTLDVERANQLLQQLHFKES